MVTPRERFAICNIGKLVYVIGGWTEIDIEKSCEVYDMKTGKWEAIESLKSKYYLPNTVLPVK